MIRETPPKQSPMAAFVKQVKRSRASSLSATETAQRLSFLQSPELTPFTLEQRTGREPINPRRK